MKLPSMNIAALKGLILVLMMVLAFLVNPIVGGYTLLLIIATLLYFYLFSFTEWGPFTQLPSGRRLDRKVGESNIVGHYLNEPGYGIDEEGNIYEDTDNKYLNELRKNFFFRYGGMVYTAPPYFPIPGLGGVVGSWLQETKLKVSKNDATGNIEPSVTKPIPRYYTAPPIFVKQGLVLSGIPIRGSNEVELGFSYTLRVTNVHQFQYRIGDATELVGDNFESMLRPKVATMEFLDVQKMSSEITTEGTSGGPSGTMGEVWERTDKALKKYGYGCAIHEINLPIVQPTGPLAEAVRQKELNVAKRDADKPEVQREVHRKTKIGMADAAVRKALADATNEMASFEKALSGVQPGAVVVLGSGAMPNFLINGGKDRGDRDDKTNKKQHK